MLMSEQSKDTTVSWKALQKGMSELTLQITLHLSSNSPTCTYTLILYMYMLMCC